jgi:hypothetical protein
MRPYAVGWRPSKALIDRALQCAIESRLNGRRSQAESKSVSADLNSAVGVALIGAADPIFQLPPGRAVRLALIAGTHCWS